MADNTSYSVRSDHLVLDALVEDSEARQHGTSQDLYIANNTADRIASKIAIEFIGAFNEAIEQRGFRAITGVEIETTLADHPAPGETRNRLSKTITDVVDDEAHQKSSHPSNHEKRVRHEGQYPLRRAYTDHTTGPELTTPPAYLFQSSHYATALKRKYLRKYNLLTTYAPGKVPAEEHISMSLHLPEESAQPNDELDLEENNITLSGWNSVIHPLFLDHGADDFALLYAGPDTQSRLDRLALNQDPSRVLDYKKLDTRSRLDHRNRLSGHAAERLEYRLPHAAGNSHLAMLQVASYLYLACKSVDDHVPLRATKRDHLELSVLDSSTIFAALHDIDAMHDRSSVLGLPERIKQSGKTLVEYITERFQKGGLLEASVNTLTDEIEKDSPEKADMLREKFHRFKEVIVQRTEALEQTQLGPSR